MHRLGGNGSSLAPRRRLCSHDHARQRLEAAIPCLEVSPRLILPPPCAADRPIPACSLNPPWRTITSKTTTAASTRGRTCTPTRPGRTPTRPLPPHRTTMDTPISTTTTRHHHRLTGAPTTTTCPTRISTRPGISSHPNGTAGASPGDDRPRTRPRVATPTCSTRRTRSPMRNRHCSSPSRAAVSPLR